MRPERSTIVAALLAVLLANGCHKPSTQSATAANSGNPAPAMQPGVNGAGPDNSSTNSTAVSTMQGRQAAQNEAPAKLIVPSGTPITVRLQQRLSSASAVRGERFVAVVDEPVVVGDQVVVPVGAVVEGHVIIARHSGRLRHPGELGLTLDKVTVDLQIVPLTTSHVVARGGSQKKRNWGWIGGGGAGGAMIGTLVAGGKGALMGSAIGGVAGTTTALVTGKKDVVFDHERRLQFRLNRGTSLFG